MKIWWVVSLVLTGAMCGQNVQSGKSAQTGAYLSQGQASGQGGPLTYAARTDAAVFGTGVPGELLPSACGGVAACLANAYNPSATTGHQGAALSYTGSPTISPPAAGTSVSGTNINGLSSYLNGVNSTAMPAVDPDFGTPMYRATDLSFYNNVGCLGGGNFGMSFNMGSSGDTRAWSAVDSHGWRKLLIQTSGGTKVMVHFNPANGTVIPTNLCGGYLPGATTNSGISPAVIYTANNDQENTIVFSSMTGTPTDAETLTQDVTGATATLYAVNSSFIQVSPVSPSNVTADNTHTWRGVSDTFVPNSSYPAPGTGAAGTPYANTVYQGVINDSDMSTDYRRWSVSWSLLFNFNYLPAMAGDPHFPSCATCGLPQNYNANYTGVFSTSDDDSTFTIEYSDNGQANHNGYDDYPPTTCTGAMGAGAAGSGGTHVCTGPVYEASYRVGYGVRAFNSMTGLITGDWGPTGQAINGQANMITVASTTGTPTPDDIFIQDATGAETQLNCMEDVNGQCVSSGWQGGFTGWTQAFTGLIYPGASGAQADGTHIWRDCGTSGTACGTTGASNYFTPSAAPANAPFYYPDVLHDGSQFDNPQIADFSMVQQPDMKVTGVCNQTGTQTCAPPAGFPSLSAHQTVISYANNATYSPGQQFVFLNLSGAHDGYLECSSAAQCPKWTVVAGGDGGPSGGAIVITDTVGTGYSDPESQTGCGNACPTMTPWGQGSYDRTGYVGGNFWQSRTLVINSNIGATGHSARGYNTNYQGKNYQAYNFFNTSTPATNDGTPAGARYAPVTNLADAETPPPGNKVPNLLPFSVVDDQHGTAWSHGTTDLSPVALVTTLVCGQGGTSGVGTFVCPPQYASIWDSEIVGIENAVTRSSPGNLVGADCNYGSGAAPCVYRLGHTFNTDDNWNFNGQNAIGTMSPDGIWLAFPSDWNKTLGCMDGTTTNCWSSWEGTAPAASGTAVAWSSDGASPPNVTIAMTNSFCPVGGSQYYWVNGAVQTIACGTRAATVKLTGFAEAWLNNQTLTLGANASNSWQCDSTDSNAGVCGKFVLAGVTGAPANSSGTESGTQKVTPTPCGTGVPCQREDIWIAKIAAAHQ